MKFFKYSVVDLIDAVRARPVIWDKTLEIYKDREERRKAWVEIFRLLDESYNQSPNKRSIGDIVINKWTNVRDTFMRTIKKRQTKSNIRKYVHHDEMSFLLKVVPQEFQPNFDEPDSDDDPVESPVSNDLKQEVTQDASEEETNVVQVKELLRNNQIERKRIIYDPSPEPERRPRRKHSRKSNYSEPEENPLIDFVDTADTHDPRIMNEDEAFFASLLPTVVNYSEDERLEFRIDVLAVMKNISQKRRMKLSNDTD